MDKNSTPATVRFIDSASQSGAACSPSEVTLARIRQFARAYVCFRQTGALGGMILN